MEVLRNQIILDRWSILIGSEFWDNHLATPQVSSVTNCSCRRDFACAKAFAPPPPTGPTRPQRDDKLTNYRSYLQQRLFRPLSPPFLPLTPVQTSCLKCRFPYFLSRVAYSFGASNATSLDSLEINTHFKAETQIKRTMPAAVGVRGTVCRLGTRTPDTVVTGDGLFARKRPPRGQYRDPGQDILWDPK